MYKRYQVLLPDWLENYFKLISSKYNLSFSEIIRLELCFSMLSTAMEFFKDHQPNISRKDIFEEVRKYSAGKIDKKEFNRLVSKIYFETRKAVEYMMENESGDH
ncbi:MAG: hypothetical protein MUP98_07800 [Candidatus Aminicenantes bacterium]|nr:hypothetical protein [Candidatus Aminicenantes bacterium]